MSGLFPERLQGMNGYALPPLELHPVVQRGLDWVSDKPYIGSFLIVQGLFWIFPVSLFLASILLSLLAAAVFVLFWAAVGMLVLLPCLCVATSVGFVLWAWGFSMYQSVQWLLSPPRLAPPRQVYGGIDGGIDGGIAYKPFTSENLRELEEEAEKARPTFEEDQKPQEAVSEEAGDAARENHDNVLNEPTLATLTPQDTAAD